MDDLKEKTSKVLGGTKGAHTAKKNPAKQKKTKRVLICLICVVVVLAAGYLTAVYSNIPFIANLRTLYIETAMNTLHHQWLATAFIPGDVIDKVMADIQEEMDKNQIDQSDLPPGPPPVGDEEPYPHPPHLRRPDAALYLRQERGQLLRGLGKLHGRPALGPPG